MNRHLPLAVVMSITAITVIVLTTLLAWSISADGASPSTQYGGVESTHEVPQWMNRICPTEDSTNCWYSGGRHGNTGPIFVRQMPGTNRVCVLFADHPRRDYCERRR